MPGAFDRVHRGRGGVATIREAFECGEGIDVLAVLFASTPVAAPVLGADESLRRALAFGDMSHVQPVSVNHPVEVLASVLTNPEPVDLCHWLQDECLQFPAIGAGAGELDVLPPVGGRRGRVSVPSIISAHRDRDGYRSRSSFYPTTAKPLICLWFSRANSSLLFAKRPLSRFNLGTLGVRARRPTGQSIFEGDVRLFFRARRGPARLSVFGRKAPVGFGQLLGRPAPSHGAICVFVCGGFGWPAPGRIHTFHVQVKTQFGEEP